jgi:RNA polymerase sigma factor (sigma-70 family)
MGVMTHAGAEAGTPPPEDPRDATATRGEAARSVDSAEPARWERAAALFIRWRTGDSRAMDELVRLMTPPLWHVVRAYGLDAALAQDVVQTTWLTLVRRHETILDAQAVSGWLTMCARREAWRVGKQQRRADPTEAEALETHLPVHESAEQTAATDDASRRLWVAVGTLNERCQRLLRIVAFEDRPDYARIAQDLAMPIGSIGPTRQRCLAKLRAELEGTGWGGDDDGD